MNKKGIELSINFLVTIILAITIFVFGIAFARNLLGGAEDITTMTQEDLDANIESLLCPGDERVCFGMRTKTLRGGELAIFGVRVLNVLGSEKDFTVSVEGKGAIYTGENTLTEIEDIPEARQLRILPDERTETLLNNEDKNFGIGVQAPRGATSGKYVFDVTVTCVGCSETYGFNKLYVDIP